MNIQKAVKVLGLMLASAILGAMLVATAVGAENPIRLFVNGVEVQSDVPPQVINGRTMIPARALAEALGARVEWDAVNRAVMVYALASGGTPTDLPSSGNNSGSAPGNPGSNSGSAPGNRGSNSGSALGKPGSNSGSALGNPGSNSGSSPSSPGSAPGSQQTPAISINWAGTWDTNNGQMVLTQTGNNVTGTYAYRDGQLTGTVEGNVLTGVWSESPTFTAPNDKGKVVLTMSADGKTFSGHWMLGFTGEWWAEPWTGTRK